MENNVHHDVYNADVCTRATRRGEGRGTQRAKKEKKIGMGQGGVGWGERSGDEKEEENRRGEHG